MGPKRSVFSIALASVQAIIPISRRASVKPRENPLPGDGSAQPKHIFRRVDAGAVFVNQATMITFGANLFPQFRRSDHPQFMAKLVTIPAGLLLHLLKVRRFVSQSYMTRALKITVYVLFSDYLFNHVDSVQRCLPKCAAKLVPVSVDHDGRRRLDTRR